MNIGLKVGRRVRTILVAGFLCALAIPQRAYSATAAYVFSNVEDYDFNPTSIEFSSGQAQLKPGSDWYHSGWTNRKQIVIDNSSNPDELTNHQVEIKVQHEAKMQGDFDDIRFTISDGTTLIDHWLEEKTNSSKATFWVEVPSVKAFSEALIYIYYGNAKANSGSDGDATFLFFDDFTSGAQKTSLADFSRVGFFEHIDGHNPILSTGIKSESDYRIREIGNIIYDGSAASRKYKVWYTGWNVGGLADEKIHHAYSEDGITWTKSSNNPVIDSRRAEDPYVVKHGSTYYLFAEDKEDGGQDKVRVWTSSDGESWSDQGQITGVKNVQSPVVWVEEGAWYMIYEQYPGRPHDIRLATSEDGMTWIGSAGNPILGIKDTNWGVTGALVPDDVVKTDSVYYLLYHAMTEKGWDQAVASSKDLIHWSDSPANPLEFDGLSRIVTAMFHTAEGKDVITYYSEENNGIFMGYPITAGTPLDTNTVWSVHAGKWSNTSDFLVGRTHNSQNIYNAITAGADLRDYILEFDAKASPGNRVAATFRNATVNKDYFFFDTHKNGRVYYHQNGTHHQIGSQGFFGNQNFSDWHRYQVNVSGASGGVEIELFLDEAKVFKEKYAEASNEAGRFGFGGFGTYNLYDNVRVRTYTRIEPSHSFRSESAIYTASAPAIIPTKPRKFASVSGFHEIAIQNEGEIRYQISNDGGATWYWYQSGWQLASGDYAEANSASQVNSSISTFPEGPGKFLWKAYLGCDGTQQLQLNRIDLTFASAYQPEIIGLSQTEQGMQLTWKSRNGQSYAVESSTSLEPESWAPMGDFEEVIATGIETEVTDPQPLTGEARFYRILVRE